MSQSAGRSAAQSIAPTTERHPCPGCGYDLTGLRPGACPECARVFSRVELWRAGRVRAWRWIWLGESIRLANWLWVAMLLGLGVLRLLEGEGLAGWLGAAGVACAGLSACAWQRGMVRRAAAQDPAVRPSRLIRWSIWCNSALAIMIAVPIAGIAFLLVFGGLVGSVLR